MIRPGDIILVHSNSLLGKIVRFFNKSYWNHAAIAIDEIKTVEADFSGVRFFPIKEYDEIKILRQPLLSDKERSIIAAIAMGYVGHEYDFFSILGWILKLLFKTDLKIIKLLNAKRHYYCSELILTVYYKRKINLFRDGIIHIHPGEFENSYLLEEVKYGDSRQNSFKS